MSMMGAFQCRECSGNICLTRKHLSINLKRVRDIQRKRVPGRGSQGTAYWACSGSWWRIKSKGAEVEDEPTAVRRGWIGLSRGFGLDCKGNRKSSKDFKQ